MAQFSKATKKVLQILSELCEYDTDVIAKSTTSFLIGRLYMFNYPDDYVNRVLLCVSNKRTGQSPIGTFISSAKNPLVSVFKLHHSPELTAFILRRLYKVREECDYYKLKPSLLMVFGKRYYRTYNIRRLTSPKELEITQISDDPTTTPSTGES